MGGRVLIVDDQPELLAGLTMLLEAKGIEVVLHSSLITLPLIVREARPDVVLLDLSMPALSGAALFRVGRHKVLPTSALLVLFSGRGRHELVHLAGEFGADGVVCKSDEPMAIVATLQDLIAHHRALTGPGPEGKPHVATRAASSSTH